jgi:DNA repair photolyase
MPQDKQLHLFEQDHGAPAGPTVRGGAVVREVACRSVLNRKAPADYSFNCYTGCTHGCVYCYARFMQRFHPHREPWGTFVDVKINAAEVMARQVRRFPPGHVFTCSACDGWQGLERHYRLTRECCRILLEAGFGLGVLTKSDLVRRDFDLFAGRNVSIGVTITTPDETLARLWEPGASTVAARLQILREARRAGLRTAVMFGPLLPALSDTPEALRGLFALAAEAEVDRIWTDALNPRPRVWPSVQELLGRRWPGLVPLYRRLLFDAEDRARYQRELGARVRAAATAAGMAGRLG